MWIEIQDGTEMFNTAKIASIKCADFSFAVRPKEDFTIQAVVDGVKEWVNLGTYSSKEQAYQVYEDIQKALRSEYCNRSGDFKTPGYDWNFDFVFNMPRDLGENYVRTE